MPLVNMRHVFLNEFSKHFYIQKSPSELLYIKHSVGDFGVLMGTEVPVPLLDLVGTEVPVPTPSSRQQAIYSALRIYNLES